MKATLVKLSLSLSVIGALLVSASSYAALPDWQNRVTGVGARPATTLFSNVGGSSPILVDVGSLSGDRSFEFIVNAGLGGGSSAFLGTRATGSQGLKFEQWQDSGVYGLTVFGIVDLNSTTMAEVNVDTHVVFVSDGTTGTDLYVNGTLVHTFSGRPLEITGMQGLAGISEGGTTTFTDILDGNILGFASYDSALSAAEVFDHYKFFAGVPEPSLTFEEFLPGTRVSEIYSPQGVHFVNDFRPGGFLLASPVIIARPGAPSPGNVLLNGFNDCEIGNSANSPLVFWFDNRMASVSMFLGVSREAGGACSCLGPITATVSFRDCNGNLLSQLARTVTTSFNTFVQFTDPQRRIRRVDIDYGNHFCGEEIDNLSFTRGTGTCTDTTAPVITITSHTNDQFVIEAQQFVSGFVIEPGILRFIYINGVQTPFRLASDGRYYFDAAVVLQEGNNTITFIAENASVLRGSTQLRLFLGTPVSATLNSFHLTQRGVMLDQPCDVDTPLVVGKTAVVRVGMDVRTASGMPTYASSVKMKVWRVRQFLPDLLAGEFFGNSYSAFNSSLNSPSDLAAVHFWIPGYTRAFDVAGNYRFEFEAFVGSTKIGTTLSACGGQSFPFTETKPVRLLILPVERGRKDPIFNGTDHVKKFYLQLDTIARAYPVRDGVGIFGVPDRGLIFHELSPLLLCDGPDTEGLEHCDGTDWTWDFIEKHPSGLLRRGIDATVRDPQNPSLCDPNNTIIGGRITTNMTATYSYNPALGIYRIEPIPEWPRGKHVTPQDEDHDGDVDAADIAFYAAEFFDTGTGAWTTDFNLYDQGETFRHFRDLNGNSCLDSGEPQSLVRQRGINERTLLWDPAQKALEENNKNIPGTANDFRSASLWFPDPIIPPVQFGASGPGQGQRPGKLSWIRVMGIVAMAHELGHNFDLPDLYLDNIPDDLVTIENAWAVYINGQSKPPNQVFDIMGVSDSPDREAFSKAHYQKIFDQLKITAAANPAADASRIINDQFVISGIIHDDDGRVDKVVTSLSNGLQPTPVVENSPYSLVFGQGNTLLSTVRFALDQRPDSHGQGQNEVVHYQSFHVVTEFAANTQWVEVRRDNQPLIRLNRSAAAPTVRVRNPNGGESFGAAQSVTIQWDTSDADSPVLRSSVYYSADGGANWSLLAAALRGTRFLWNTANSLGTTNGLIRVVVSDGFNTSEDRSDARFSVAGKPPHVVILEPRPGQTILECARPIVRGVAEDLEGPLNSTLWTVDGNRGPSQLEAQLARLSPGSHVLRLEAIDASGQTAFDEVTVQVLADSDCDGMSDEFENANGLNPGSVNDARGDQDSDGLINFDEALYGTMPSDADTDDDLYPDGMEVALGSKALDPLNTPFTAGLFTNALYINCGGEAILDGLGRRWHPDHFFLVTSNSNAASFTGTVDTSLLGDSNVPQAMLLTERWKDGDLNYRIPARNGFYSVILYFSENCRACVNPNLGGTGPAGAARIFDITVENIRRHGYNQADAALPPSSDGRGATFKATQLVSRDVMVSDGVLNVDIIDLGAGNPPENAAIKGMAIFQQAAAGGLVPPRIASIRRVGNLLRIEVDSHANLAGYHAGLITFELQQTTDFVTWTSTAVAGAIQGGLIVFELPLSGNSIFYRVHVR